MKTISFVIPCYKSEKSVASVIAEISAVVSAMPDRDYEIIAVDDASPDGTFDVLHELARENPKIIAVSFLSNFGQHAGMMAGVRFATGEQLVFLDDDGQCPLDQLPALLKPLELGYDIVIAKYGKKKQSWFKNLCSRTNELVANALTDKPKGIQMGNFMAISRTVIDEIRRYSGPYPYISGLLFRTSHRVFNVPMEERERMDGNSTYTLKKLFALWMNSFTAFSVKPLRMAIFWGMIAALCGFLYGMYIVICRLAGQPVMLGWSSLIAVIIFMGGLILIVLGIIGEYIGRIYMTLNQTPQYVIRQTINMKDSEP